MRWAGSKVPTAPGPRSGPSDLPGRAWASCTMRYDRDTGHRRSRRDRVGRTYARLGPTPGRSVRRRAGRRPGGSAEEYAAGNPVARRHPGPGAGRSGAGAGGGRGAVGAGRGPSVDCGRSRSARPGAGAAGPPGRPDRGRAARAAGLVGAGVDHLPRRHARRVSRDRGPLRRNGGPGAGGGGARRVTRLPCRHRSRLRLRRGPRAMFTTTSCKRFAKKRSESTRQKAASIQAGCRTIHHFRTRKNPQYVSGPSRSGRR